MKFTSLKDVKRFLEDKVAKLRELTQLADISIKRLEASVILDISGDGELPTKRKSRGETIGVDFPVTKVPNKAQLTKDYRLAEELSHQYRELEEAEAQIHRTFKSAEPKVEATIGAVRRLKTDIENKLRALFKSLNKIAEGHAPKEFKRFLAKLANELSDNQHIECDSIENFIYVAINEKGELVFAGYIVLVNAVSDEGQIMPHLYVALRWTIEAKANIVEVFIEHDFVEPTRLQSGELVKDTKGAVRTITNQLSLEGFSSQIGNLPMDMHLRNTKGMTPDAFSAAPYIDKIEAEKERVTFIMRPGIKRADDIQMQLYQEMRKLLKNRRKARLKMKPYDGKKIVFTITQLDQGEGVTPHDLEWLEDKYGLTQQQLRRVANEINGG